MNQEEKCRLCGSPEKLQRCAGCKVAKYCSESCQTQDWKSHKVECKEHQQKAKESNQQSQPIPQERKEGKSLDSFKQLTFVGQGNFSEIYSAIEVGTDKKCAIKKISKRKLKQVNKEKDVFMEKHCLSRLKGNPYAIEIYSTFQDDENLYIQFEYVENGELWHITHVFGLIAQSLIKYFFGQIIKAIESFHQIGIVHRDIKSENILLTNQNTIKFIDFGTARDLQNPHIEGSGNGMRGKKNYQHFVGTPQFMAPECIRNRDSNEKSDIYSLGCLFYQMINGNLPFEGGSEYLIFTKALEEEIDFPKDWIFTDEQIDLIRNMTIKNHELRYSLDQVKQHSYWGENWDWNTLPDYQNSFDKANSFEKFFLEVKAQLLKVEKLENNAQKQKMIDEVYQTFKDQINSREEDDNEKENWIHKLNILKQKALQLLRNEEENDQIQQQQQ